MSGINRDDWLKALADVDALSPDNADAVTVREFMATFHVAKDAAQRRLNALVNAGKATKVQKLYVDASQRHQRIPAYRLKA